MKSLIVYDDFYADPDAVRDLVFDMGFEAPDKTNYPGRNSTGVFQPAYWLELFSDLAGERLVPAKNSHCGGFRIQHAGEAGRQYIHVDLPSLDTRWAGVCYLTPGWHPDAGTCFWRHRRTGLDALPYDTEWLKTIGIGSADDLYRFMNTEGTDPALWTPTSTVGWRWNRLILFRSNQWHSQGELFGDSDETGRLIQTFFFEVEKGP